MNFEEKLKSEIRVCSICKLKIENPFVEKCPRCFNQLEKIETNCNLCHHNNNCSLKKIIKQ